MSQPQTDRQRWVALYVLCAGMLMIVLDATVVNVALPSIQDDLGFSSASLAWVVNAYLITFGGLLLLSGRLGDLLGRRRIFLIGLAVFTVASLLCGAAMNQELLVAARFLQGVGGALTSAVILGMIVTLFPDQAEQGKAIGVYAFVASAGGAIGLLAGGVLTQLLNWHWIFLINVPIGIATAVVSRRLLPGDGGAGAGGRADVPGAVLITGALMLGVYTIVKPAAEEGWTAASTLGLGAIAVLLLAAFVLRQARAPHPLVPLRIFRIRAVVGANVIQLTAIAGMFGLFFLGALYLERVLRYDPLGIGLAFLPTTVLMGTLSLKFTDGISRRIGARTTLVTGLVVIGVALALFTRAPVDGSYAEHVLPVMALLGLGAGLAFPVLVGLAMSGATPADAGLASGLVNTTAQVGGALGLAVLATLSAGRSADRVAAGVPTANALVDGYHLAFWVATGFVVLAIVIALTVLPAASAPAEVEEPAEAFAS